MHATREVTLHADELCARVCVCVCVHIGCTRMHAGMRAQAGCYAAWTRRPQHGPEGNMHADEHAREHAREW